MLQAREPYPLKMSCTTAAQPDTVVKQSFDLRPGDRNGREFISDRAETRHTTVTVRS